MGRYRKLNETEVDELVERYQTGDWANIKALGAEFGISKQGLYNILRRRGVSTLAEEAMLASYDRKRKPPTWVVFDGPEGTPVLVNTAQIMCVEVRALAGDDTESLAVMIVLANKTEIVHSYIDHTHDAATSTLMRIAAQLAGVSQHREDVA